MNRTRAGPIDVRPMLYRPVTLYPPASHVTLPSTSKAYGPNSSGDAESGCGSRRSGLLLLYALHCLHSHAGHFIEPRYLFEPTAALIYRSGGAKATRHTEITTMRGAAMAGPDRCQLCSQGSGGHPPHASARSGDNVPVTTMHSRGSLGYDLDTRVGFSCQYDRWVQLDFFAMQMKMAALMSQPSLLARQQQINQRTQRVAVERHACKDIVEHQLKYLQYSSECSQRVCLKKQA